MMLLSGAPPWMRAEDAGISSSEVVVVRQISFGPQIRDGMNLDIASISPVRLALPCRYSQDSD